MEYPPGRVKRAVVDRAQLGGNVSGPAGEVPHIIQAVYMGTVEAVHVDEVRGLDRLRKVDPRVAGLPDQIQVDAPARL
jgi:hypothetical protein